MTSCQLQLPRGGDLHVRFPMAAPRSFLLFWLPRDPTFPPSPLAHCTVALCAVIGSVQSLRTVSFESAVQSPRGLVHRAAPARQQAAPYRRTATQRQDQSRRRLGGDRSFPPHRRRPKLCQPCLGRPVGAPARRRVNSVNNMSSTTSAAVGYAGGMAASSQGVGPAR